MCSSNIFLNYVQEEIADFSSILEYEEIVRKLFASEDEGFEFYNKYAFDKGFSVRKSYMEFWNIFVILEHFGNACLRVCLDPTL